MIDIDTLDLFLITACTQRYCLGRKSYIVGWYREWVEKVLDVMPLTSLETLAEEVTNALKDGSLRASYIEEFDCTDLYSDWEAIEVLFNEEIKRRKGGGKDGKPIIECDD